MREINRTTVRILDKVHYLNHSTETQLDVVSPELNVLLNTPSEDPPTDYRAAQKSNIRLLNGGSRAVQETSQAHRVAKVETSKALRERDQIGDEVTGRYRGLRSSFKASYKERWRLLGLQAPPEREHTAMYERCGDLVRYLLDPQLSSRLGEPEAGQPSFDFQKLGSDLAPRVEAYKQAIDRWVEAKKRRDDALVAKKAAVKRLHSLYANIARIQEGYFRLAGLEEMADRIRLTIPRSSRKPSPAQLIPAA